MISCVVGLYLDVLSGLVGGLAGRQSSIWRVVAPFFFICDCKERILVAGWCTDLVRGTKTARKKRMEIGREVRNCKINRAKKRVKQTNVLCNLQKEQMIGIERAAGKGSHTPPRP